MSKVHSLRSLAGSVVLAFAVTSFAAQSQGGGLDLGGLVGGTVNGLTGGGISAKANATVGGSSGVDAKAKASIGKTVNAKARVVLFKKKKHYAHKAYKGNHHSLVKIYAKVDVNNKHYKGHHSLAKVYARVDTRPVDAKLRLMLGKKTALKSKIVLKHTKAKVFVKLGGYKHVAHAKAIVKTDILKAKVRVGIGGTHNHQGTSQTRSSTPGVMASRLPDLARSDRDRLITRCVSVLAAPQKFDDTIVSLCRMVTTL